MTAAPREHTENAWLISHLVWVCGLHAVADYIATIRCRACDGKCQRLEMLMEQARKLVQEEKETP